MEFVQTVPETAPETAPAPPISGTDAALPVQDTQDAAPETLPEESGQTSGQEQTITTVEVLAPERPIFTTPLADYSVTEGLLLCIFILLLCRAVVGLVKEVL